MFLATAIAKSQTLFATIIPQHRNEQTSNSAKYLLGTLFTVSHFGKIDVVKIHMLHKSHSETAFLTWICSDPCYPASAQEEEHGNNFGEKQMCFHVHSVGIGQQHCYPGKQVRPFHLHIECQLCHLAFFPPVQTHKHLWFAEDIALVFTLLISRFQIYSNIFIFVFLPDKMTWSMTLGHLGGIHLAHYIRVCSFVVLG